MPPGRVLPKKSVGTSELGSVGSCGFPKVLYCVYEVSSPATMA